MNHFKKTAVLLVCVMLLSACNGTNNKGVTSSPSSASLTESSVSDNSYVNEISSLPSEASSSESQGNSSEAQIITVNSGGALSKMPNTSSKESTQTDKKAAVITYPAPSGAYVSEDFTVTVNGYTVDLYSTPNGTAHIGQPPHELFESNSFGYFDFSGGPVTIKVTTSDALGVYRILPESYKIKSDSAGRTITFTVSEPKNLTFVFDGNYSKGKVLQLFMNNKQTDDPRTINGTKIVLLKTSMKSAPVTDQPVVFVAEPGYYNFGKNIFMLKSNQSLYIAGGAVLDAFVAANKVSNVKIYGRGIICQSTAIGSNNDGIFFLDSENITIKDIIENKRVTPWSSHMKRTTNVKVSNYRVVSPMSYSSDGLNFSNCKDVLVENSYFRTGDDCISLKGQPKVGMAQYFTGNPMDEKPQENITIKNCQFWSNNNNAVVVGEESVTPYMKNIKILDCDVLYCESVQDKMGAISIISMQGGLMTDILFENIRIGPCGYVILITYEKDIYGVNDYGKPTIGNGNIKNVTFKNITQTGRTAIGQFGNTTDVRVRGWDETRNVENVVFDNVSINGKKLTSGSSNYRNDGFTKNITFK